MTYSKFDADRFGGYGEDGGVVVRCRECDEWERFYGRFDADGFEYEDTVQRWEQQHKCAVCLVCGYADGITDDTLIHPDCFDDDHAAAVALIAKHYMAEIDAKLTAGVSQ